MSKKRLRRDAPVDGEAPSDDARRRRRKRLAAIAIGAMTAVGVAVVVTLQVLQPSDHFSAMNSGHYSLARDLLEPVTREGDARAQNTLGNLYYLGLGGERNQRLAVTWYLKAALQDNSDAQINVARHYVLGLGVPKDVKRAFAWLYHARSNGSEVAEGHMNLLAGSILITPNEIQLARELYPTVDKLRPQGNSE